jgi:hypothetical protein
MRLVDKYFVQAALFSGHSAAPHQPDSYPAHILTKTLKSASCLNFFHLMMPTGFCGILLSLMLQVWKGHGGVRRKDRLEVKCVRGTGSSPDKDPRSCIISLMWCKLSGQAAYQRAHTSMTSNK